jgi:hypothetical protein
MPEQGRLRVYGEGGIEVELVISYLTDLRYAYNSIAVFETTIDRWYRASREFPFPLYAFNANFGWMGSRRALRNFQDWPTTADDVSVLIPQSEQLVLAGVHLESPGFWDFLGKLNLLEVIRQYLNDRHERRKDREYRESAEARRLRLENLKLENEVISGRIKLAKDLGATEHDLAPLLNQLVYRPLTGLDRHQDRGAIDKAEIPRLPGQINRQ